MALIFDFTNGAHDCANAIATVVSTKVLSPRTAVIMAATLNPIGAFLGTKGRQDVSDSGIVHPDIVANCQPLVLVGPDRGERLEPVHVAFRDVPSSSSHALIGGLMGAAVAYGGFSSLNGGSILTKHTAAAGPLPSGLDSVWGCWSCSSSCSLRAKCARNKLRTAFTRLQVLSAAFMATSHGNERCPENDGGDHPLPSSFSTKSKR